MVLNAPVKQAILQSGTLEMSPPRPLSQEGAIVAPLEANLASVGSSLRTASAEQIIKALAEANIVSMWIQQNPEEPELSDWTRAGQAKSLLVGDVEYEVWSNRSTRALMHTDGHVSVNIMAERDRAIDGANDSGRVQSGRRAQRRATAGI